MSDIPEHSILSPSSAERWTDCTASIYLAHLFKKAKAAKTKKEKAAVGMLVTAFLPEQDLDVFFDAASRWIENATSVYAEEGTRAHEMGEKILKGEMKESDLPEEFACVAEYTSTCRVLHNRWGGEMFVESRVPLSYYPKERGTVDNAIVGGDRICITDYKHGAGVMVDAEDNLQLAAYACSFLKDYENVLDVTDDTIVDIRIIQPRVRSGDTEKLWSTTVGHLKGFQDILQTKADLILSVLFDNKDPKQLTFSPTIDNCRFCSCKASCPARDTITLEPVVDSAFSVTEAFADVDLVPQTLVNYQLLSPQQKLAIFTHGKAIVKLVKDVEQWMTEQASLGHPVDGTKLVSGRQGNRAWTDEKLVRERLLDLLPEEEIQTVKLLSPTQITAALEGAQVPKDIVKAFDDMVSRSPGKPVLALLSDKRPALATTTETFGSIQDDSAYEG